MSPSIWQVLILLVIIILLFGTSKLKNVGSDLGSALKGFKKAIKDDEGDKDDDPKGNNQEDADFEPLDKPATRTDQSATVKNTEPASQKPSNKE